MSKFVKCNSIKLSSMSSNQSEKHAQVIQASLLKPDVSNSRRHQTIYAWDQLILKTYYRLKYVDLVPPSLSVSLSLCLYVSVSLSLCLCLCLSLSVCLSLSLDRLIAQSRSIDRSSLSRSIDI